MNDEKIYVMSAEEVKKAPELAKKQRDVGELNKKIAYTAKTSYLAGDSPEAFFQKVGAAIDELGEYVKENF